MSIKANLIIEQGADFMSVLQIRDTDGLAIDLTGYTGEAQMRKEITSNTAVNFVVTLEPVDGKVYLALPSAVTANLEHQKYVYDCFLTSANNIVSKIIEGTVTVSPSVTR